MGLWKVLTRKRRHGTPPRPRKHTFKDWTACLIRVGRFTWKVVSRRNFGTTLWSFDLDGLAVEMWPCCSWYGDLLVIKRRSAETKATEVGHLAPIESDILSKCHALVAHCAATKYDDGTPRQPGWWTVRTRGSAWELEIKDPETCCRLVIVQQTLDDALALAQTLLETEDAPWEADQWLTAAKAKQRKK